MQTSKKVGAAGAIGGAIAIAVSFIQPWEGVWLTAKVDTIGTGQPITWCFGETKGHVRAGQHFTLEQCKGMLAQRLPQYDAEISPCIHVPLSDKTHAALISASYNAGPYAMCHSSVLAKINAGDLAGGCKALGGWYIRARGRIVKGLKNRRAAERRLCLEGLEKHAVDSRIPAPVPRPYNPHFLPDSRPWWRVSLPKNSL